MMRLLFVGESWLGSCARSLKEALGRQPGIDMDEVNEDTFFLKGRTLWLRGVARLIHAECRRAFEQAIIAKVHRTRYDAVIVYKGQSVSARLIREIHHLGALTVNVFPDYSPWVYGAALRQAVGGYDLVISTKSFHPAIWNRTYGYTNACVCVPQGYDPELHLDPTVAEAFDFDVVMVATFRPEYGRLMIDLAKELGDESLRVAIGGNGWGAVRKELPANWAFTGPVQGRGYVSLLRRGKVCIAPLTREVFLGGQQLGDVDSTRSYELAAARCFFVHRRTDYLQSIYDEVTEVPMFDDAKELACHIRYFLKHDADRRRMADAAHRRAVPAYSLDARAQNIVQILGQRLQVGQE